MRFHLFAVLAGLSLVQCSFDGTGLHGYAWPEGTAAAASSTTPPDTARTNNIDDVATAAGRPADDDDYHEPATDAGTTPENEDNEV